MKLEQLPIDSTPTDAWRVVGERFAHIGEWAAPIHCSTMEGPPEIGAIRRCEIAPFGPVPAGVILERLIEYDAARMTLLYVADGGLPGFIAEATNRWSVHADGAGCIVRMEASLILRGPMVLLGPLIGWRMRADGRRVLEDLRHLLERGATHPRKASALASVRRGP